MQHRTLTPRPITLPVTLKSARGKPSLLIAHSRLSKHAKKQHQRHHDKKSQRKDGTEAEPAFRDTLEEEEEYEKTHPHGIAKILLDIKTALYSWLGTGIEPL